MISTVTHVIHFLRGKLIKVDSHHMSLSHAVTVQTDILAHRVESGVLIQTVSISNGGKEAVPVYLSQKLENQQQFTSHGVG